jgi:hypothetical protein
MTDKTKLDEAATLNVSNNGEEGVNSSTSFTAEDTLGLVQLLKAAGVQSQMFNGPANLTVDVQGEGGMVTTNVGAPNLRAIMNLLEPDFELAGQMDDSLAAQEIEAELEEPYADHQAEVEAELAADEINAPVKPLGEAIDDHAFDMSDGLKPGDDRVEIDDYGDEVVIFVAKTVNMDETSFEEVFDMLEKAALEAGQNNGLVVSVGADQGSDGKMYGQHLVQGFNDATGEFVEDDNAQGTVIAWAAWRAEEADLEEEANYDYRENEAGTTEYAQRADKKVVQPATKRVPARSGDNPLEEGVNDTSFTSYIELPDGEEIEVTVEFDYDSGEFDTGLDYPKTGSFGEQVTIAAVMHNGQDIVNQLDHSVISRLEQEALDHLTDGANDDPRESIEPTGFKDYLKKVEAAKNLRQVKMVGEDDLIGEYRGARADSSTKYGQPMYLNTDCGYASFNDLGSHEYFHMDHESSGVTIVKINRNGKWGFNYVSGYGAPSFKPGQKVTVVTQTSTGDKYREGEVVDTFTSAEYVKNKDELLARLEQHGIKPDRKLSVKTFD